MKKEVLDEAFRLETGCVNRLPLDIAEVPVTCGLHMDCNEFLRFLEHIIRKSAQLTIELFPASVFVRLVHRFALHKSANTCLLAKVSPFVIDMLQDTYRLCESFMLGLGILG